MILVQPVRVAMSGGSEKGNSSDELMVWTPPPKRARTEAYDGDPFTPLYSPKFVPVRPGLLHEARLVNPEEIIPLGWHYSSSKVFEAHRRKRSRTTFRVRNIAMAKRLARKMQLNGWGSVNEYMVGELLEELPRQLLHDLHLYGRCDIQGFATFGMNRMYDPERMYVFGGVEEQIQHHVRVFF